MLQGDQSARLNVRNTNVCANLAETVPDETGDDARPLYCEWDEHGERFKPFRKSVLESKTFDWNHGRIEGAPTCLHICKAMEKLGGSPRQELERFLRDKHISGKAKAARELRCLCDVLEEAACFDQLISRAEACLELAAGRLNLIVDARKQGGILSHVNAKYLTALAETDEILVPGLQSHMSTQSAKKADTAAALTDSTKYDDDGGNEGGGSGKRKRWCKRI